jgi:alpha-tubulin suppressor-like RCC1 family protein
MIAITAGRYHSLGIHKDPGTGVQTAWAWGYDEYGTCGQGNAYTYNTLTGHSSDPPLLIPSPVVNLTGVVSVAGGWYHSLAALSDGTVWAWGPNVSGCLGQPFTVIGGTGGSPVYTTTPMQVPGISNAVAVASGWFFSMALLSDGTVMVWGDGTDGEYGIGDAVTPLYSQSGPTPVQVQGLTGVVAIAAGSRHAMALKSDGTVWCWGNNDYGQLGNNSLGASGVATLVQNLGPAVQIAAGQTHSMARLANGTIWLWGQNQYAELGTVPVDAVATPQILTR